MRFHSLLFFFTGQLLNTPFLILFSLSIDPSSVSSKKYITDDQRARGVEASKLNLLKGVLFNKNSFTPPLFIQNLGLVYE